MHIEKKKSNRTPARFQLVHTTFCDFVKELTLVFTRMRNLKKYGNSKQFGC